MAGLVPAIHGLHGRGMRGGWVYIMTNRPNGTLYVGVTNDIARRAWEHREGLADGFTKHTASSGSFTPSAATKSQLRSNAKRP